MADITHLWQLFSCLMLLAKCCGYRKFYYDNALHRFRMFYMDGRFKETYFCFTISFIFNAAAIAYIILRIRLEIENKYMNELENGVRHKAEFISALLDCSTVLLMCVCFIYCISNQKDFMNIGNKMLMIHHSTAAGSTLQKVTLKCNSWLLLLTHLIFIKIIVKYIFWIKLQRQQHTDTYADYLYLIRLLRIGVELQYDLHFVLLTLSYVLLSCYYRQLNDFLLQHMHASRHGTKRLQKLLQLLPKLNEVQHFVALYFRLHFATHLFILLRVFAAFVGSFKYDEAALHPFVGMDDEEEEDASAAMYHAPRRARHIVIFEISIPFVVQIFDFVVVLSAAYALRGEKLELQQNLLYLVNFPEFFQNTKITDWHLNEIESDLNAITESVAYNNSPKSCILDLLFAANCNIIKFTYDAEVFLLQTPHFSIPFKQIKAILELIMKSAFVLFIFDIMQLSEIEKLEQLSAKGLLTMQIK